MPDKIKLHGFNNLTKSLAFNIYDVCYAGDNSDRQAYMDYIDEAYNAERLTQILDTVASIIGANILNVARADYDPLGASVTMLISEEDNPPQSLIGSTSPGPVPETLVAHLDKSHLTVHTYPESHPDSGISTFRADIDVSTCGRISPLKALNYLIHEFDSDIVIMDYRVRGFTRDVSGQKYFIDHRINSIQEYIDQATKDDYQMVDVNVFEENIFHTKMMRREFELQRFLFTHAKNSPDQDACETIGERLQREMQEIFYGRNYPDADSAP